ncbi:putative patatin/cPLA2 family phospholipase [Planomicrobium koreense]|uniref:Putative patatin/cPLA2 family phospholipase n=1 Tax=Planococcus koreensis TaxID=112331 RepID=A0A7W8CQA0_9BACL|nr:MULTISPECIES: patatin family protein [Planococcus]MBB5179652.1 putative patatin/cPLA2 family phospholipase [Planococcus koreensis]MDN3448707.1 patatin family protein [Planococcus sp. APC 3906]
MKSGLILEGGGMRGVYTGGVLEKFLEEKLFVDYIIGVSAGACNASSYVSRQSGRNREVTIGYVHHPDYISVKNLLLKRELFGMNLIFDEIPNRLVPFDYKNFNKATEEFVVGTTDCMTGEAIYYKKNEHADDILSIVRASSSIPLMARPVEYNGRMLMDGGLADPLPIRKALEDEVTRPVIILTKEKGYRKKKNSFARIVPTFYRQFPGIIKNLEDWAIRYNATMELIEKMEAEGTVLVIRPSKYFKMTGMERDVGKLTELYDLGYKDTEEMMDVIYKFISH